MKLRCHILAFCLRLMGMSQVGCDLCHVVETQRECAALEDWLDRGNGCCRAGARLDRRGRLSLRGLWRVRTGSRQLRAASQVCVGTWESRWASTSVTSVGFVTKNIMWRTRSFLVLHKFKLASAA